MINRIKKITAWLLMTAMVMCLAAGCGNTGSGSEQAGSMAAHTTAHTTGEEPVGETDAEAAAIQSAEAETESETSAAVDEDGSYNTKDDVALYLHTYGRLPGNYITKKEAQNLGWDSKKGNLQDVAPGKSIGGSHFGNYEGQLPERDGRKYFECDLGYEGGYRGAERLIYSNDGLIYYTGDHYKTFEQLY